MSTDGATIREATAGDLPRLIELWAALASEPAQETASAQPSEEYVRAFEEVAGDRRQRLLVLEREGRVIGTATLIIVPNVTHQGRRYALVENVVVDAAECGAGYGGVLMRYAIEDARRVGCYKLTLTSRLQRVDAHRFYERLGFTATSKGFRIEL
jgi:N-acetylglutamate synthase-like GNAT family acetyltransferase